MIEEKNRTYKSYRTHRTSKTIYGSNDYSPSPRIKYGAGSTPLPSREMGNSKGEEKVVSSFQLLVHSFQLKRGDEIDSR